MGKKGWPHRLASRLRSLVNVSPRSVCKLQAIEASPWELQSLGLSWLAVHTPAVGGCDFFAWIRVVEKEVCWTRQSSNEIPLFAVAPLFLVQSSWESFCACSFLLHISRSISDNWQQSRRKWFLTPTAPCCGLGKKALLLLFSFFPLLTVISLQQLEFPSRKTKCDEISKDMYRHAWLSVCQA